MAKLAALLAALLLVAHASSAFRTTLTTIEADNGNNPIHRHGGRSEQCREQVAQRNLCYCMQYVREQLPGFGEEEFNTDTYNRCCNELRKIHDEQCLCDGLEMEMRREREQGRIRPQDIRQMMSTAQRLPNECGIRPSQCQFEIPDY